MTAGRGAGRWGLRLVVLWLALSCARGFLGFLFWRPVILTDEISYWHMARSFFESGQFLMFGDPFDIPNRLYPILLSPLVALPPAGAFACAKLVGALLFTAALFPAWGWARDLLGQEEPAAAAALLAATVPAGVYTSTVMAENLFYPLFVLAGWLGWRTLARGGWGSALGAGTAFALAFYTKPQVLFLLLPYGVLAAVWAVPALRRGTPDGARPLRGLLVRALPPALFGLALLARVDWGRPGALSPSRLLFGGVYTSVVQPGNLVVDEGRLLACAGGLAAILALSCAFLPAVAALSAPAWWRQVGPPERWFVALAVGSVAVSLAVVAKLDAQTEQVVRLFERYLFVLAPTLFLLWFLGAPRLPRRRLLLGGALAVAGLALLFGLGARSLLTWNAASDSPAATGLFWLALRFPHPGAAVGAAVLTAGALCLWAAARPDRPWRAAATWSLVMTLMAGGWYGFQRAVIEGDVARFSALATYLNDGLRPSGPVAFVADGLDPRAYWFPGFWLRVPSPAFGLDAPPPAPWWGRPLPRPAPGAPPDFGTPVPQYVVASPALGLALPEVARFPDAGAVVYRDPRHGGPAAP